ncbi:MAG: 16S rRNA processing protein RimM [Rhodospirillaceae bacterium]|nr:16S rRNA processing protein RimM [Rhodospirillaceae bacterium]
MGSPDNNRVCLGIVAGPQGLQGAVRIRSYTACSEDIASYGRLSDVTGEREFSIRILRSTKKGLVAELSGVDDRMAAEKIKGLELYVSRDALPEPNEEEFYYSDLIGLDVEDEGGKMIGQVTMMDNYGAGEVMEVTLSSGEALLLPFTRKVVPVVDVAAGKIQIVRPAEVNPGQEEVVNDEGYRA